MTNECLGLISTMLNDIGINYEFVEWTSDVPSTYWVGEYVDNESLNEDGLHESTFMLTGTTFDSWLTIQDEKNKIEDLFPSIPTQAFELPNGSRVMIAFGTSMIVPTDVMDLKRIQINLTIKEWMVK